MDSNLSQNILQSSKTTVPSSSFSSSDDSSFFDAFKNINIITVIVIILIFAFLGFNIFDYLAKITQAIIDFFSPFMENIFGTTTAVTGQVVNVSAEGAKAVVSGTSDVLHSGLTSVQNITPNAAPSSVKGESVNQPNLDTNSQGDQSTLNRALNTKQTQESSQQDYQAHEASSSVHSAGKAGWCFIGEDRGFRTCGQVGINDTCMSGEIFPSQEICMNPNLRS
jgi:hypothetical protein